MAHKKETTENGLNFHSEEHRNCNHKSDKCSCTSRKEENGRKSILAWGKTTTIQFFKLALSSRVPRNLLAGDWIIHPTLYIRQQRNDPSSFLFFSFRSMLILTNRTISAGLRRQKTIISLEINPSACKYLQGRIVWTASSSPDAFPLSLRDFSCSERM